MKEFKYTINGNVYNVTVSSVDGDVAQVEVNGTMYNVQMEGKQKKAAAAIKTVMAKPQAAPTTTTGAPVVARPTTKSAAGALKSPLPGVVLDIAVNVGDVVKKGDKVMVLEAMKMENNISADRDGKIAEIKVNKGDSVLEGADLVVIE